ILKSNEVYCSKKSVNVKRAIKEHYDNKHSMSLVSKRHTPYSKEKSIDYDKPIISDIIEVKDSCVEVNVNVDIKNELEELKKKYKWCFLQYEDISKLSIIHLDESIRLLFVRAAVENNFDAVKHIYDENVLKLAKMKENAIKS
ncbi:7488_t:CDS:2, partial [Racocetra fulgida]